ncbi:MAG: hypothetical protein G01um101470_1025, partial [Parcubacteria group bacterium Gr01-1014_70]
MQYLLGILWKRMILMGILLVVFLIGAIETLQYTVGPLTNALWKDLPGNIYRKEAGDGLAPSIPIVLDYEREIAFKEDLQHLQDYTMYLKVHLPGWMVESLSTYKTRRLRMSFESNEPYISDVLLKDSAFTIQALREELLLNKTIIGLFVTASFRHFVIQVGYPPELDELSAVRELRRVVERRYPPDGSLLSSVWYYISDYLYYDFKPYEPPTGPAIYVGGWPVGKSLISWGLFFEVLVKGAIGFLVLLVYLIIMFAEWRYALPIWFGTLFAFIATIGSMLPLGIFNIYMTVWMLPSLVGGLLIVSLSFNTQCIDEVRRHGGVRTIAEWTSVTTVVSRAIRYIFFLTISCFFLFGLAYQSLWIAVVMNVVFVLGTLWAWIVQKWFLPALYFFVQGKTWRMPKFLKILSAKADNFLENSIEKKKKHHILQFRKRGVATICVPLLIPMGISLYLVFMGYIDTNSRPISFLGHHLHARHMMDKIAELGMTDVIPIAVDASFLKDPFRDEVFLQMIQAFEEDIRGISGITYVSSLMDQVFHEITRHEIELVLTLSDAVTTTLDGAGVGNDSLRPRIEWNESTVKIYAGHPMDNAYQLESAVQ